ncbi:MAG: Brp/Blh family beta-carotene 15,15'-dioxygenase [Myxococcota bacterium]
MCGAVHGWRWCARPGLARFFAICMLLALTDVVVGFALYFSLWHATDHVLDVMGRWPRWDDRVQLVLRALPNAALSVGAVLGAVWAQPHVDRDVFAAIVLVGLAAVTLPHAAVYQLAFRARG